MNKSRLLGAVCACSVILIPLQAFADDKTWSCGSDYWNNDGCWSPTSQPITGDNVFLTQSDATDRIVTYTNAISPSPNIMDLTVDATGTGTMTLSQSQDSLFTTNEYIGYSGTGIFEQSAGTNSISGFLYVGYSGTADGTYTLNGTGSLLADNEIIGRHGSGVFTQNGGTHTVTNDLVVGRSGVEGIVWYAGDGTYNLNGGSLSASNIDVGEASGLDTGSHGIFNQTDGSVTVTNRIDLSNGTGGRSIYNISGGSLNVGELGFWMTDWTSSTSEVNQTGGTVTAGLVFSEYQLTYNLDAGSLTASNVELGMLSRFNQTGGENVITNTLSIAESSQNTIGYTPVYTLSGGTLDANDIDIAVAELSANRFGVFDQIGGTNTVTGTITLSGNSGASGTYNLSDGKLDAANIVVNSNGSFNFDGGTLSVDSFAGDLQNNGGTLTPGDSPGLTNIFGNYGQSTDGTYAVEIGGTGAGEFDILDVAGIANLDGTLDVSLFDLGGGLFSPTLGDTFDILLAETISGEFDILSFAGLGNGLGWDVSYILSNTVDDIVRLSVQAVPIPASVWLFGSGLLGLVGIARRKA